MQIKVKDNLYELITEIAEELGMARTVIIHMAMLDLKEKLKKKEK